MALLTRNVKFTSRPWTNGGADAGTVRVSVMLDENGDINTGTKFSLYMGLDATKPVLGISIKASFKPVSSTTETR